MLTNPTPYRGHAVVTGPYRYLLTRSWGGDPRELVWIMLNPSVADASADDPTIRRVRSFSQAAGFQGFSVINLFAAIATDPMRMGPEPVGPDNDRYILDAARLARQVVCAWGALVPPHMKARARAVLRMIGPATLHCLGTTKAGHPRHPLYVRGNQPLVTFRDFREAS